AVKNGFSILGRHIENILQFVVPAVVSINHFYSDTDAEIQAMKDYVASMGEEAVLCKHWAKGSAGIEELDNKVVALAESGASQFAQLYHYD
ncbi:formate--tetrahydrofolate ligase, partial [Mesorhizobium japonicum]|uniref:formate--tetrahydrofolate ligase n=1 Tax=Mesorhizobium japonicum TaxID=2066070 RepID=UPI003B59DE21